MAWQYPKANGPLTIALVGDVMLGRLMNDVIHTYGPLYPWGNTLPLLREADLTLINLECVIAANGRPWTRTPKVFHFRADPEAIEVLKAAGVDYVSLANNHSLDFEEEALLEMLRRLDDAGIAHSGAGRDLEDAQRPAWLRARGRKIAILSFTDNEPAWAATSTSPGVNFIPVNRRSTRLARFKGAIRQAREDGADLVITSAHWGPNMRQRPSPSFVAFAHEIIDAGSDVFHGHSAHIFQGIELYAGKPIFYDAGDFVDDYAVDQHLRNDQSILFRLHVQDRQIRYVEGFPVLIQNFQVNLATGRDFDEIAERMQRLSGEMGTTVEVGRQRLRIAVSPT